MTNTLPEWNLADFYSSPKDPLITKDFQEAERLVKAFAKQYEGRLEELDAASFTQAVKEYEIISELLGKIGSYAQLLFAGNMNLPENAQFYQNTQETITNISSHLLFFTLSINKLDDEKVSALKTSSHFQHYAPWLEALRILKPYQLSDEVEKLLHEKQVAGHAAWSRHFDEVLADLRFPFGNELLALEEILHYMSDTDEKKRKEAALSLADILSKNTKTFALITNTLAKDKAIEDEWRKFERPISSRNIANQVEDAVVDALMESVKANYKNLSHRYYQLKAGWLGKEKLAYWDRAAPLPKVPEKQYNYEEAKELVLSAYRAFSPQLAEIGQQFFDKNWIDVGIREGKASGAFAHPCVPSVHPYILLNFQGKARDVMTLAHELGHGVHQVLAAKQGCLLSDTPLTLAETASVFGEMLTFREILRRETNPLIQKSIIAAKVEDMLATVVRQVAMCQFEVQVHDERKSGELTSERIGEIWREVQSQALGEYVELTPEYNVFWAYIPHFIHTPFYVYAYAFGDCLVNSLYSAYEKEVAQGNAALFVKKYIAMLESGGRYRHKELLAPFGLDASKPAFWQGGLDVIAGLIDELEKR